MAAQLQVEDPILDWAFYNDEVVQDGHDFITGILYMREHICLCAVKEYLDRDGPGGKLKSLPLLRALLMYTRLDDLEGKPQLRKLLHVAVMVCHVYLAAQKSSSDEFRRNHLDALTLTMDDRELDPSLPNLPISVVAKAKCCTVALNLAVDFFDKAEELAQVFFEDQPAMAQYGCKLMQTLQSLEKGDTSVEGVLEAFSMATFLEEFDSGVEELYTELAPPVVAEVCKQLGMEKVLLTDPLAMTAPTHTWEGFEAAAEKMARGRDAEGEGEVNNGKDEEDLCGKEEEEEWEGEEVEEGEGEDTKATSSRKSDQRTILAAVKRRRYHIVSAQKILTSRSQ